MKETQLGPGSHHGEANRGAAVRWVTPTGLQVIHRTAGERATQPTTSSQDGVRDEAAAQPRDGCAAGMSNGRGAGALRPGISVLATERPDFRTGAGGAVLDPSTGSRSGRRLSLVKRHRESRARSVRPLRVGDGPSRFLGGKRWKKPETASIISRTTERREGPYPCFGPAKPKSLAPT